MKATELRIGNWVYDAQCQMNIQIGTGLHIDNLDPLSKPIPLTEEWLERFGFEYNFDENPTKNHLTIEKHFNGCWFRVLDGMWSDGIKIEYVHQLQNLYFALTGEELELKQERVKITESDIYERNK